MGGQRAPKWIVPATSWRIEEKSGASEDISCGTSEINQSLDRKLVAQRAEVGEVRLENIRPSSEKGATRHRAIWP